MNTTDTAQRDASTSGALPPDWQSLPRDYSTHGEGEQGGKQGQWPRAALYKLDLYGVKRDRLRGALETKMRAIRIMNHNRAPPPPSLAASVARSRACNPCACDPCAKVTPSSDHLSVPAFIEPNERVHAMLCM
jgi:hypothetical protein